MYHMHWKNCEKNRFFWQNWKYGTAICRVSSGCRRSSVDRRQCAADTAARHWLSFAAVYHNDLSWVFTAADTTQVYYRSCYSRGVCTGNIGRRRECRQTNFLPAVLSVRERACQPATNSTLRVAASFLYAAAAAGHAARKDGWSVVTIFRTGDCWFHFALHPRPSRLICCLTGV